MGSHNPDFLQSSSSARRSVSQYSVVIQIILVTVGVYILQRVTAQSGTQDSVVFEWLALERDLVFRSGQVWRLLTYAFCHSEDSILHLVCNMTVLYVAGRVVAGKLGRREFLWVYLTAAVFAGMLQACCMAIYRAPGQDWLLGASGAVYAIFVLFALHYPRTKLYFFGLIPIQARWLLLAAVAYDSLGFLGLVPHVFSSGSSIGHAAHLGGLIFGFLYFQWNMNLTRWWNHATERPSVSTAPGPGLRVFNPGFQPEVTYSERVDDVLAKISREGEHSLTDRERRILNQASEHLNSSR